MESATASHKSSPASPVAILGPHRSGTSMMARAVHAMGIDLGPETGMVAATEADNPEGYWEQRAIVELNDELLAELGGTALEPPELPAGWEADPRLDGLRERARALIEETFDRGRPWGWKDPRTSLTLPFWRGVVGEVRCIVCVRDPADVAASLSRRYGDEYTREAGGTLWLHYQALALAGSAPHPRLLVHYDDLVDDPGRELPRLAEFLGVPGDGATAARHVIKPGLRRNRAAAGGSEGGSVPGSAQALYLLLRRHAADGGSLEWLDRIAGGMRDEAWRAGDRATRAEHELAALRAHFDEVVKRYEGRIGELETDLAATRGELERHRHWLESLSGSLSWRLTRPLRAARRPLRRRG